MDGIKNRKLYYMEVMPFQCRKCSNRFITQHKLNFHEELVHSKGLHYCAKCDFTCTSIGKITWHNQTHIREIHYKAYGTTDLIPNNHFEKSVENDQFNIQGYDSDKEDHSASYSGSFQVENSHQVKQTKINSFIEIEKHNHEIIVSSSNNDLIEINNINLEARSISNYDFINSDFVDNKLNENEEVEYIKALDNTNNNNIEMDGEPIDKDFILESNSIEAVDDMVRKTFNFEPMSLFIELIDNKNETLVKCNENDSQRKTEREDLYPQNDTEEQITLNNTLHEILMHKEDNTNNNLVKPASSKIDINNCTGITNKVKKLMLKVQSIDGLFQCPECKKMYKSAGLVKRHLLIHTGEKPFQCTKCYYAFNQNIQLQRHMKIIHNEGLFKCIHCDETFVQQIHLSRHLMEHAGIAPFSCKICQKKFLMVRDVKKHMKYEHEHNTIERVKTAKPNNGKISCIKNKKDFIINKLIDKNKCTVKKKGLKPNQKASKMKNNCQKNCESHSDSDFSLPDINK